MKRKKIQSLFDITIGQFQKYHEIENPDNTDIVSVFYDISREDADKISKKQIDQEANNIRKVLSQEPKFVTKYKGLGFEPDLDNMASGAFADAAKYGENIETFHLFTAVMYRPIIKNLYWLTRSKMYNIKEYDGAAKHEEKAKQMPLALTLSAHAFFLTLRESFITVIRNRLAQKSKQLKALQKQKDSTEIGDGVLNSMQLLEEIILNLKQLPENRLQRLCII